MKPTSHSNSSVHRSTASPISHRCGPAMVIALLSTLLAWGLNLLGLIAQLDVSVAHFLGSTIALPKTLAPWVIWTATLIFSLAIALAILSICSRVKRLIISVTTLVICAAWAPVLVLAAHEPNISAVMIATSWAIFCAWIYAERHPPHAMVQPPRKKSVHKP